MPKTEAEAMQIAYDALRGQDAPTTRRMVDWLAVRLEEDRRGAEVAAYAGPAPQWWEFRQDGCPDVGSYETREEGFEEVDGGAWCIVEITGHAAVCQEFVVMRPSDDGPDHESFATRALAEAYATEMRAGEAEYLAKQSKEFNEWLVLIGALGCEISDANRDELLDYWQQGLTSDQAFAALNTPI